MLRSRAALVMVILGLGAVAACGGSGSDAGSAPDPGGDPAVTDGSTDAADDDSSDDGGSVGADDLGVATLIVEPEGVTFEVTGECEIAPEGFEAGTVEDLAAPGVEVSIGFDNTTEPDSDFIVNLTAATTVGDDGAFTVQSRGGLDNDSVSYRGSATAGLVESNGLYGVVAIDATLAQTGPVTDPTGDPVFADQPAERTITGEIPCTIGIS